jgi:hypothetical protein
VPSGRIGAVSKYLAVRSRRMAGLIIRIAGKSATLFHTTPQPMAAALAENHQRWWTTATAMLAGPLFSIAWR